MQLILFVGAGVSVPSGLPTAKALTDRVLRAPYHDDGNGNIGADRSPNPQCGTVDFTQRIRDFLGWLHTHDTDDIQRVGLTLWATGYKSSGAIYRGASTYEDLFFLCQQISLWNCGLSDNSLTTPFMEAIECRARRLLHGESVEARLCDLATLGEHALGFLQSVVADMLRTNYVRGFDLIQELLTAQQIEKLHIVTLNHDTLLEQYLSANNIPYIDGFGEPDGDVRWAEDSVYDALMPRVRLLKLHGSINWYSFSRAGRAHTAIPLNADPSHRKDANGEALTALTRRPSFLSGTNKTVHYQNGIFGDMHFRFAEVLRKCERMIISGFGWSDSAITFQLDTWLDRRQTNRIILLHEDPQELTERSLIMASGHDGWVRAGQLIEIKHWLAEATLSDVERYLP